MITFLQYQMWWQGESCECRIQAACSHLARNTELFPQNIRAVTNTVFSCMKLLTILPAFPRQSPSFLESYKHLNIFWEKQRKNNAQPTMFLQRPGHLLNVSRYSWIPIILSTLQYLTDNTVSPWVSMGILFLLFFLAGSQEKCTIVCLLFKLTDVKLLSNKARVKP